MAQGGRLRLVAFRLPLMILAFLLLALPAWAGPDQQDDLARQYARAKTYYDELAARDTGKDRNSWLTAATAFRSIYKAAPEHAVAPKSLYMLGKIFQAMFKQGGKAKDSAQAIAAYEELSTKYPGNNLADDAFFILGNIYLTDKNDPAKAARAYAKIIAIYPEGDMAGAAEKQLLLLKAGTATPALTKEESGEKCLSPLLPDEPSPKNLSAKNSGPATVLPIRYWSNKHYTRLIIEATAPVTFKHQTIMGEKDSQRRIYFDLHNSRLSPNTVKTIPIEDGLLRRVRNAQFDPETVRVVLDTQTNISDYKIFTLDEPFRLVIDVMSNAGAPILVLKPGLTKKMAGMGANKTEAPLDQRPLLNLKKIVIDPGHGGKDPGTIGPSGLKEKDVTLAMSLKIAERLRETLGCEVILTRDRDVFLPLEERTAIANKVGADLFISVHANAAPNRQAFGIETYYLNFSKNDKAAAVAARENGTTLKEVGDLELILFDLMANAKINESSRLAAEIQRALVGRLGRQFDEIRDLGVRQGPFYVLLGATMPSVLVEAAFISHPREERRLATGSYHEHTADAIADAVLSYARAHKLIAAN